MIPADTPRLQEVFRREYRSLLQYVREASPYASGADIKLRGEVLRIAGEEVAALSAFGDWLDSARVPLPYLGSFPFAFTDCNFVAIRSLVPRLIAEQKVDLAKLEADAVALAEPAARDAVARLVDLHRQHLIEMESLGEKPG